MNRWFRWTAGLAALLLCGLSAGCYYSSSVAADGRSDADYAAARGGSTGGELPSSVSQADTVLGVPPMRQVGDVAIPRMQTAQESLVIGEEVPADVGNPHARQYEGDPVTGDWLIVSFSAEPETMNPITEQSAVQTYIGEYINEPLAWQNPETLKYEPNLAKKWVAEDSVKLSPDYPGKERRVARGGGRPATELEVEYKAGDGEEPVEVVFTTTDKAGDKVGNVWVGLDPAEEIVGVPTGGYHFWSDEDGELKVSGIEDGKYTVRVGAEVFGQTVEGEDGSLTVTPATAENPLSDDLREAGEESLKLAEGEWIDVQRETIYTYYLKPEVEWSDGTPFTTKDLEFAYAVINNPYVDGESLRVYYSDVVDVKGLDDHSVRMKYRQQYFNAFEFTMGLSVYTPPFHQFAKSFREDGKTLTLEKLTAEEEDERQLISAHGQRFGKFFNTDDRYNRAPLGTGPYVVDKWVRADRIELVRNPDYWGQTRRGYLDRLIFKFIPDTVTAYQALRAGEIDFLYRMSAEQYHQDLAGPPSWFKGKYVKADWFSPGFTFVGWNLLRPKFQDRRVRVALSMLFDKAEFLETKLHGSGVVVAGSQYYFGPAYDHSIKPLAYSPEIARELLADAGWVDTDGDGLVDKNGEPFRFTLLMPQGKSTTRDMMQVLQWHFLKDAGIQMDVRETEWASFIDLLKQKNFDAVTLAWASPLESDPYQIWHSSGADPEDRGSNMVSFADPQADKFIERIRVTLDEDKRMQCHAAMQRILDREQPYMFLYTSKDFGAYHKRFHGVKWFVIRPGFDLRQWFVPKDQQVH